MGCCEPKKPEQLLDKSVQGNKDQIIRDEKDTKLEEEMQTKEHGIRSDFKYKSNI